MTTLPSALARQTRFVKLADVPALLAHPDWERAGPGAPVVIWMHGRTVNKELDNGRYLRWIRAGIAACAIDLPGHGERLDESLQQPARTLEMVALALLEVDRVFEALGGPEYRGKIDLTRAAIGGISAGGMVTLRRLCEPHPYVAATVEATAGDLGRLSGGESRWRMKHDAERLAALDPMQHLEGWRPIPLLALHSEKDEVVPVECVRGFVEALRARYMAEGEDAEMARLVTWPETGAAMEHNGFGRVAHEAKTIQTEFLARALGVEA